MPEIKEIYCRIKGSVQGVGFRWTVVEHAEKNHIKGVVKNLSDGSVEIYAQGSEKNIEQFLKNLHAQPGNAIIQSLKVDDLKSLNTYSEFKILF
jgi:acylphosphatase